MGAEAQLGRRHGCLDFVGWFEDPQRGRQRAGGENPDRERDVPLAEEAPADLPRHRCHRLSARAAGLPLLPSERLPQDFACPDCSTLATLPHQVAGDSGTIGRPSRSHTCGLRQSDGHDPSWPSAPTSAFGTLSPLARAHRAWQK
jgi:hypothetical protein